MSSTVTRTRVPLASNAALDQIVSVQLLTDLLRRQRAPFVLCDRTVGNYRESIRVQLPDLGDYVLSQALTEELLIGLSAQVFERQDRQYRFALVGNGGHPRSSPPAPNCEEGQNTYDCQ